MANNRLFGGRSAPPLDEWSAFQESLRILRSNLSVALLDLERPTVIFTSPNPSEGKTVVCSHLAMSFAAAGQRVVLVDLDLRHPNAHRLVGAHNEFGVSDVLLGRKTTEEAVQYITLPQVQGQAPSGLYFLGTGSPVANPTELLDSSRTRQLLDALGTQADLVLLDTPPILPVADTLVIGRMAAGAVMITESRNTAIDAVNKAKDLLTRNQTRLLGVVLNKFHPRGAASIGYGYGTDPEPFSTPPMRGDGAARPRAERSAPRVPPRTRPPQPPQ